MPKPITYLSPSSLMLFERDPEYFYKTKILGHAKEEQTKPMVVGTGFDAFVKHAIDPEINAYEMIKDGVDSNDLMDFAIKGGKECFGFYKNSGALASLMLEMGASKPDVIGQVNRMVKGVPLHGRPDLKFILKSDIIVIDWKVNGFCSVASPAPEYIKLWDALGNEKGAHKNATPMITESGIIVNASSNLEDINKNWATQLATYSWVLGIDVGDTDFIVGLDQIVWSRKHEPRCAKHRYRISAEFQYGLMDRYKDLWDKVQTGKFLGENTEARSQILEDSENIPNDWLKRAR